MSRCGQVDYLVITFDKLLIAPELAAGTLGDGYIKRLIKELRHNILIILIINICVELIKLD